MHWQRKESDWSLKMADGKTNQFLPLIQHLNEAT